MADTTDEAPARGRKRGLLIGGLLGLVAAAAGFFAVSTGLLPMTGHATSADGHAKGPEVTFLPVEQLIVSLGRGGESRHLRFDAQLEVAPQYAAEVETLMPRVVDVMNGYLRAVDIRDLEDPAALIRLRAQLLRRVQIVTGEGRVRDLLIMEFVLS